LRLSIENKYKDSKNVYCTFGFYTDEKAKYLINKSDFVILPYTQDIAQSGVKELSLGLGTPVIVSNVGGLPEGVHNFINGYIIEGFDEETWVNGIKKVANKKFDRKNIVDISERERGAEPTFHKLISIINNK